VDGKNERAGGGMHVVLIVGPRIVEYNKSFGNCRWRVKAACAVFHTLRSDEHSASLRLASPDN